MGPSLSEAVFRNEAVALDMEIVDSKEDGTNRSDVIGNQLLNPISILELNFTDTYRHLLLLFEDYPASYSSKYTDLPSGSPTALIPSPIKVYRLSRRDAITKAWEVISKYEILLLFGDQDLIWLQNKLFEIMIADSPKSKWARGLDAALKGNSGYMPHDFFPWIKLPQVVDVKKLNGHTGNMVSLERLTAAVMSRRFAGLPKAHFSPWDTDSTLLVGFHRNARLRYLTVPSSFDELICNLHIAELNPRVDMIRSVDRISIELNAGPYHFSCHEVSEARGKARLCLQFVQHAIPFRVCAPSILRHEGDLRLCQLDGTSLFTIDGGEVRCSIVEGAISSIFIASDTSCVDALASEEDLRNPGIVLCGRPVLGAEHWLRATEYTMFGDDSAQPCRCALIWAAVGIHFPSTHGAITNVWLLIRRFIKKKPTLP